ncbi:beta-galactosidase-1-like protein 2 [Atheta coriaria]|uniref:beta-galactosidase-1-like protein 2 n=1 Tax=Dalotia coriaria TaxID=877792 RepID=UPI0031F357F3
MSLPTVYEYYAGGGISAGLSTDQPYFTLNNKNITIYSGAMHYFRVPQDQWRDRLQKMRAAGLNTVETYIPWNLHEFQDGVYDIGNGGSDFSHLLNIQRFLEIAQEEDLLAIIRPGPYICSEWEFGGLPSWLLKNKGIRVRTSDELFMARVTSYFTMILSILSVLNWHSGGPIIAYQIENEYGSLGERDMTYLNGLKQLFLDNGVKEMLFTSDGASIGNLGQIPGVLYTANFAGDATNQLNIAQSYQPGKPSMVMEYWSGWFDHWTEQHHTTDIFSFTATLLEILNYPASVNFYMFHGGTNFGFMNGANSGNGAGDNSGFQPTTNSYDYDAPLNEHGDYTEKYWVIREILKEHGKNPVSIPDPPESKPLKAYPEIEITDEMSFSEMLQHDFLPNKQSEELVTMEEVDQKYGYITYRKEQIDLPENTKLKVLGYVTDTLMVLLNGELLSPVLNHPDDLTKFGYWKSKDQVLELPECTNCTLDLIVENWGRVNFGGLHQFEQRKGFHEGQVLINDEPLQDVNIISVEFPWYSNPYWEDWTPSNGTELTGPKLCKATLTVDENEELLDTYVDMRDWTKGIVIVNDYVLSRYSKLGPQQALYLPGSFLKKGENKILVFEHFNGSDSIKFSDKQIFETVYKSNDENLRGI